MARKVTQLSSNYIKLDLLPKRKDGKIDWMKSCGCNVDFRYCNIIDTLKIEKVERKNNITYITVSYENNSITLQQGNFTKCRLGKLLSINNSDDVLIKWKYEIGDNVVDDLYVLDRKIINHRQCYKISCKKCNFKSQSYYVVKKKN